SLADVPRVRLFRPGTKGPAAASHLRHPVPSRRDYRPEETMRAAHKRQPFTQRSTARRSSWWQRIADLIATLTLVVAVTPAVLAQSVDIAYNTFLDPNNA